MNWRKIFAIVRREYTERIRTKAFWIATLIIPFLFVGLFIVQIAIARKSGGERRLAVVDMTGHLYAPLASELTHPASVTASGEEMTGEAAAPPKKQTIHWVVEPRPIVGDLEKTKETLRKEVLAKKISAYLLLDPARLRKDEVEYYSTAVSEWMTQNQLERAINHVRLREKIVAHGLAPEVGNELDKRVDLRAFKVTESGTAEEKGAGIIAAMVFFFLMYSTFFMYGYQVMRGVIEEKSTRIVEIVIASVRPTELMLGKIIGIGLVGLTQYFAWSLIAMNLSLPGIASLLAGSDMAPKIPLSMLGFFILFFLFGYFLYASIYTAIAAPFNTDQEAQQLAMIPMAMIVSGIAVYPAVMNNPSGGLAVFVSLLPFTAPLMMFLRTALGQVPAWQIVLSVVLLAATTVGLAWFAGRVYRVGILMYGKKPTIPEILRWVRYSPGKAVPAPAAREGL
ncbi:MAG: ABC transporter permease [Acidobacteria bacterium]|nr:ABC transporter permease [Acidobacteriota bacterium]MCA1610761.1 ABC transporter permease [Acidobacteriota bacterium]